MPRKETVLNVFVASPSDVIEERKALEIIVGELNKTWSNSLGLRLDLLKWETDVYPGLGHYSQEVINQQIADNYDVFISIFWGRYGSPTKDFGSGTIEEIERALAKYREDETSVDIMIYFKDQPIPPSKIDPAQLTKIHDLKKSLGDKGCFYSQFGDIDEFETALRTHLSKVAQRWSSNLTSHEPKSPAIILQPPDETETYSSEDYGLLDYHEIFDSRMSAMTSVLESLSEATSVMGEQFVRRTREIEALDEDNLISQKARRIVKLSSGDLDNFSRAVESQIETLSTSRREAFEALSKALALYVDFKQPEEEDINTLEDAINSMRSNATETLVSIKTLKNSLQALPRITIELNKAKRRAIGAIDRIIDETEKVISSSTEITDSTKSYYSHAAK